MSASASFIFTPQSFYIDGSHPTQFELTKKSFKRKKVPQNHQITEITISISKQHLFKKNHINNDLSLV